MVVVVVVIVGVVVVIVGGCCYRLWSSLSMSLFSRRCLVVVVVFDIVCIFVFVGYFFGH